MQEGTTPFSSEVVHREDGSWRCAHPATSHAEGAERDPATSSRTAAEAAGHRWRWTMLRGTNPMRYRELYVPYQHILLSPTLCLWLVPCRCLFHAVLFMVVPPASRQGQVLHPLVLVLRKSGFTPRQKPSLLCVSARNAPTALCASDGSRAHQNTSCSGVACTVMAGVIAPRPKPRSRFKIATLIT